MTSHCQINDQTKFHMVEGIDNVFDHMKLCFFISRTIISLKIGFQEITFITDFPGSNFLLLIYFNRWQMGFSGGKFATCYC